MRDASYIPIMLCPGWVLERYYGWSVVQEGTSLKVLRKGRGPITMFLLLARGATEEEIGDAALQYGVLRRLAIVFLNDFSNRSDEDKRSVAGVSFQRVTTSRWFGVGTFVLDLSESLDTLWARMLPKERNECRRAEKLGVRIEFVTQPRDEDISVFLDLYVRIARQRGLEKPRQEVLRRMFAGGDLLMTGCADSRGRRLASNLTYIHGNQGYYLYGARDEKAAGGVSRYAHWETIKRLKEDGFRWYDLGLVASRESSDGIYWFKRSFGGTFVDFGREFQHIPRELSAAYGTFRALRTRLRRGLIGIW